MTLTADQKMIKDEATRFLAEQASREHIRAVIEGGGGTDQALWLRMAQELGWCAMAIPEETGGLGLGQSEVAILMELAGGALAPVPLWATVCLAAPLLSQVATPAAAGLLSRIAAGELAATVALPDIGAVDGGKVLVTATPKGSGYLLHGTVDCVVDAEAADVILIPALVDGGIGLFAVTRADGAAIDPLHVMDATRPMARLTLDGAAARVDANGLGAAAVHHALDNARLGLAAEQIGSAAAVTDLTLAYIAERVQFGRTIASFQAIKHRCALLQVQLAEARALAWGAARNFDTLAPPERTLEIAALKALADDLARHAAREAIQMHGGVAMTWEYDPHFHFKRAQASATLLGQADAHLDRIAAALLD